MNVMNAVAFVVKYCQHVQGDVSGLCPCFVVLLLLPFSLLCRAASVATISHSYVTDLDPSSPCLVHVIVCFLSDDCCFNCVSRVKMPIVRSLQLLLKLLMQLLLLLLQLLLLLLQLLLLMLQLNESRSKNS